MAHPIYGAVYSLSLPVHPFDGEKLSGLERVCEVDSDDVDALDETIVSEDGAVAGDAAEPTAE